MTEETEVREQTEDEAPGEPSQGSPGNNDAQTKLVRLQADFDNFRKRATRQRGEAADDQKRQMLTALLPIYDNFGRALDQAEQLPDLKPFLTGFEMISQQLDQFLRDQGLEIIPAETGTTFDPNLHEATGIVPPDEGMDEGTVARELQKGFTHKSFVVRPARVLVYGV